MKPLASLPGQRVRTLFFDIDDTLTTDGVLTPEAYSALARWHASGRLAVPITGRPAGWCDHIARMWPVDAVVGENGAFWFRHDRKQGVLEKRFAADAEMRAANRSKLATVRDRILAEIPGCALASDQAYREADLAIDYCEDVRALPLSVAERIANLMRAAGMTAKISSIHVNGWFGEYDKLGMTRQLALDRLNLDLDAPSDLDTCVFVGDSPNDVPMFAHFPLSVGVANVRRYGAQLLSAPKYITKSQSGRGFEELVAHLLSQTHA